MLQTLLQSISSPAHYLTDHLFENKKCHPLFFDDNNFSTFFAQNCHSELISKLLGFAIVAGSMMVKVPQIMKMMANKSSEGISSTSNLLDLFMIGATLGYGFIKNLPFASYGDALFIYVQTAIILILIPVYKNNKFLTFLYLAMATVAAYAIANKLIPVDMITIAQQINIPLTFISRGIQIMTNFGNKSTGQLSGITFFLSFAGCGSRIFTSLVDAKDNLMALSFGVGFLLNGVVWGQILYYAGGDKKKSE